MFSLGIIFGLIVLAIFIAITAFAFQLAAKIVLKDWDMDYSDAFVTMLIVFVANILLNLLLEILLDATGLPDIPYVGWIPGFLLQSWIFTMRHGYRFGHACLVSLVMYVIYAVLLGILWGIRALLA